MPNKMLIDASHPEETRVVVVRGNRIEEFDFESQDKKQLKGNIYLARVTRVEPSLQAAFVEYGGNRHGFLAFNEIHPDYYQIPMADRQALLRAEQEEQAADEESLNAEDDEEERGKGRRRRRGRKPSGRKAGSDERDNGEEAEDNGAPAEGQVLAEAIDSDSISEDVERRESAADDDGNGNNGNGDEAEVESVGAEDAMEEVRDRRKPVRRQYKIQEVIKRRQILLVQVVKEERGNKGAALTTYLSLAGRYSVLMPNTARGGGISRKITNPQGRKRLKEIVKGLEVPQGMGVILRTAGESRTKAEIKRDYEYLMRLWDNVRELTLQSTAPTLVYEEGSLIKRSIRDLYNKDIGEVQVAGEGGYREAKSFMRMLMPSHAKVVQPYRDNAPIFARSGIESQLDKMVQPQVTLKSGGYIIINQTEALVAIDVNSGRSTREHSIEDTALQTNLEAADEVARQLRLRDLAGLIVIDFIDMEENRNNRAVEKRLKDCLKNDRARIQVGRISHFGLLEMSRQRIRASVLESTMQPCPHCGGTGHVRSDSSVALLVMRAVEDFLLKDNRNHITVRTPTTTALYMLNHKRNNLTDMEARFGLKIAIEADDSVGSQHYAILKGAPVENPVVIEPPVVPMVDDVADEPEPEEIEADLALEAGEDDETEQPRKRKRRRRKRGGKDREAAPAQADAADDTSSQDPQSADAGPSTDDEASSQDEDGRKKRRRGKRGGRRNRRDGEEAATVTQNDDVVAGQTDEEAPSVAIDDAAMAAVEKASSAEPVQEAAQEADAQPEDEKPKKSGRASRGRRSKKTEVEPELAAAEADLSDGASEAVSEEVESPKPARRSPRRRKKADETPAVEEAQAEDGSAPASADEAAFAADRAEPASSEAPDSVSAEEDSGQTSSSDDEVVEPVSAGVTSDDTVSEEPAKPRKTGWWQRKSFF